MHGSLPNPPPPTTDYRTLRDAHLSRIAKIEALLERERTALFDASCANFNVLCDGVTPYRMEGVTVDVFTFTFTLPSTPYRIVGNAGNGWHLYDGEKCVTRERERESLRPLIAICENYRAFTHSLQAVK